VELSEERITSVINKLVDERVYATAGPPMLLSYDVKHIAHAIAEDMRKGVVYDREVHVKEDIIEGTDAYLVSESGIVGRLYDWPVRGSQRARVTVTLLEDMLLEEEDGQALG